MRGRGLVECSGLSGRLQWRGIGSVATRVHSFSRRGMSSPQRLSSVFEIACLGNRQKTSPIGVNGNHARLCKTTGSHSRGNLDFCRPRNRHCHHCLCHAAFRPLISHRPRLQVLLPHSLLTARSLLRRWITVEFLGFAERNRERIPIVASERLRQIDDLADVIARVIYQALQGFQDVELFASNSHDAG